MTAPRPRIRPGPDRLQSVNLVFREAGITNDLLDGLASGLHFSGDTVLSHIGALGTTLSTTFSKSLGATDLDPFLPRPVSFDKNLLL